MSSNGTHTLTLNREDLIRHISDLLHGKKHGNSYQCHCPAHDDRKASLSLDLGVDGRILLYCHAGCEFEAIAQALKQKGVSLANLAPADTFERGKKPQSAAGKPRIAATYDYRDADGRLLFQTVRLDPKGFFQRRPDGYGGWINNLKGVSPALYRLPEILAAVQKRERIYIVEGEKDAARLAQLDLAATCNHGGAGKWQALHSAYLKGAAEIIIIPDNDEAGERHAQMVASSLRDAGLHRIRILSLPGVPPKGDVSDWLDAGGTVQELEVLADNVPLWKLDATASPLSPPVKWKLLSAQQVLDLSPIQWLIENEIPEGGLTVLYGDSGSGKSFLALDYALRIAQESNVVYVAGEGLGGYPDRLLAWGNHNKQSFGGFHLIDDAISMLDEIAVATFIEVIAPLKPKLIVIDTLARAMLGGDENSARDMGLFIDACNRIQHELGAAVLVVHHTGKNRSGERGSSALRGGADSMIEMSNEDGLISVSCAKSKDREPFKTRYMWLVKVATRDERDSCVLLPAEKVVLTDKLTDSQERALDVLSWETFSKAGCSARILAEQAKIPSGSVYRVLNALMKLGHVTQSSKGEPYFISESGSKALNDAHPQGTITYQ